MYCSVLQLSSNALRLNVHVYVDDLKLFSCLILWLLHWRLFLAIFFVNKRVRCLKVSAAHVVKLI